MAHLRSGLLRHRVTIQRPVSTQDSDTGAMTNTWQDLYVNEPAQIEPVSVRDFIGSSNRQSEIVAKITIRYRDGMTSRMRVLHGDRIYNPQGWLPDKESGLEYLSAPCSEGVNEGG